ncbi:MAG TPA: Ig-like domain-containing protein [Steroidobacteraceae bacterium]|nr:Ig-like domain-containing protein [Steroidobacteraceae bacterium]
MASSTSLRVIRQSGARAAVHLTLIVLTAMLAACGGGGGYSAPAAPPPPATNVVKGQVVDAYVEGATVNAYQVNADGTPGALIAGPFTTDLSGNYSLNLGSYSGPVYLTSTGGTYVDTATGQTVDLTGTGLVLSTILPSASGTVTAQITPLTTMAAQLVATVVQDSSPKISVSAAATAANALVSQYFGIGNVVSTSLLDLTKAGCTAGATSDSIGASLLLAGINDLANQSQVTTPDLIQALIQDISSDGKWDGKANGQAIMVKLTTGGTEALSIIEGNALGGLVTAVVAFINSNSNTCDATAGPLLFADLNQASLFTVPPAPSTVAATPGNGQVTVSWSRVSGATAYNLYVATAPNVQEVPTGLPGYAIHLNVTSPYVLSGLTNGTPYYMVVTAVDGISGVTTLGTESVISSQVTATPTAGSAISVSITPSGPQTLAAGGTINFQVKVNGSTNQSVTWSTSPSSVCGTFSANMYTAPTPATTLTCTLTATAAATPAAKASVTVTVQAASATLQSISLAPLDMTIAAGATQQFTATGTYSDGSTQNLTTQAIWTSSQVAVATISTAAGTDGLATGVAAGTTVISATLGNVSSETNLTVTAKTTGATALSTGFAGNLCALLSDGTVKCWGPDDDGSLGDGNPNYTIVSTPVLATTVSATNPAKGMSLGGSTTCAALTDGTIQCWGYNGFGNLGNGTTTNSLTAVTTYNNSASNPAQQVSAGLYAGCAVLHDGTAQCWGNVGGPPAAPLLGNQLYTTGSLIPVQVTLANPATAISVGNASACVLMADTTVQCWGSNTQGELGTGSFTGPATCDTHPCSPVPVPVTGLKNVTMISVGGLADVACAVSAGTVWCWGSNMYSQLGQPSTVTQLASPTQISGISTAIAVSVGYSSVCALLADGTVQCWGNNVDGQMGNGTTSSPQTSPVTVSNITTANPATAISVNENSACALLKDGTVECWGYAFNGSLGNGEATVNELVPVSVIDL